jgi:hypothetical protein
VKAFLLGKIMIKNCKNCKNWTPDLERMWDRDTWGVCAMMNHQQTVFACCEGCVAVLDRVHHLEMLTKHDFSCNQWKFKK